jgi:hypothetical protein
MGVRLCGYMMRCVHAAGSWSRNAWEHSYTNSVASEPEGSFQRIVQIYLRLTTNLNIICSADEVGGNNEVAFR